MRIWRALSLDLTSSSPHVISFVGAGGKSTALFRLAQELREEQLRVVCATTTRMAADQIGHIPATIRTTSNRPPYAEIEHALERFGTCLLLGDAHAARGQRAKLAGVQAGMIDRLAHDAQRLQIGAILVEADGSRMLPAKAPAEHEPVVPQQTTILVPVLGLDAVGARLNESWVHRPERVRHILSLAISDPDVRLTPDRAARLLVHEEGGAKGRPDGARFMPLLNKADSARGLAPGRLTAACLARRATPAVIGTVGRVRSEPIVERWASTSVVILAAGGASRMGQAKQLVPVDGESMLRRAVQVALGSDAAQVVVVTGAYRDAVEKSLQEMARDTDSRLEWVHNPDWAEGQSGSVRIGIRKLRGDSAAVTLMPVDQPYLTASVLRSLVRLWRQGAPIAATRTDGTIRGAPALFDRAYWPELMRLTGDVGGRPLLKRHAQQVVTIDVAASALRDFDSPADLARWSSG